MFNYKKIILIIIAFIYIFILAYSLISTNNKNTKTSNYINDTNTNKIVSIKDTYYSSLQEAINNAESFDTITVHSNISENIYIKNKSLTINGNNFELSGVKVNESEIENINSFITIENSVVRIENLTINGYNLIDELYPNVGIYSINSDIYITNTKITNINHNLSSLSLYPYGVSIFIVYDDELKHEVSITNNIIDNFHQKAVHINSNNTNEIVIDINNNIITGIGKNNSIKQIGIYVYGNITGDIINNQISDLIYDSTIDAIGIKLKSNNINIENNVFQNVNKEIE